MNTRLICRFATAYASMVTAAAERREDGRLVWQDIYVQTADELGIKDEDHHGLKECRAEVERRDEERYDKFFAQAVDAHAATR